MPWTCRARFRSLFVGTLTALVLGAALPGRAAAQGGANIGGIVTDDTNAALPGVTITLINTNNGAEQVLVTGPEGNYRAVNLQPGPYSLTADLPGFAPSKHAVTLFVGANTTLNITLGVATISENVIVSGESPLVEVAKAQPQSVIVGEQLRALPVLDRNFLVLAQLLPGAAPLTGVNSRFAITKFGGLADQRNGYTTVIDGGAVDDATWGSPVINMSQDAVQEFKVFRNQFDAQYGAALNAVVNVVTKSGGNAFGGTAYYFGRDKSLNARNAKAATVPPFKQYRLGGSFGGPIVQNQTHFFSAYEYLGIQKAAIVALPPSNPFASQQNGNYPFDQDEHLADARVDHRFTNSQSAYVRYAFDRQYTPSGGPVNAASSIVDTSISHSVVGEHNWVVSQNMVNSVRVHYLDHNLFTEPANFDLQVSRPSYTVGQNGVAPQYFPRKIASLFETFYINLPRHDIKVGGEFSRASSNFEAHFTEHGQFTFTTDTPFNAADSRTWPFTFVQQSPGFYNYTSNQIAAFVQDDWRLTDRLRLNLGLRYDLDTNLRQNDFYRDLLANPLYAGIERFVSADRGNDYNNLQPRAGATYDIRGDGTLVARAATGMYVTRNRPWFQETSMDKTLGAAVRITDPQLLRSFPDIDAVLGGRSLTDYVNAGGVRSLYLISDDYVLPYSVNTTAGIGWQINGVTSLDVDYVHNVGRNQLGSTDANLPVSGAVSASNPRPVPRFSQVGMLTNFSKSWYDALEVQVRTRVRGTDSLQVSYAYSKSTLDGVTFYSTYRGTERTPREKGMNPTDTPHNLSVSASTTLPFGFQLSGVFRAISGGPLPVTAGVDLDGDLNTQNDRPAGLTPTVGRGNVDEQLAIINAFRATRNQAPVTGELLKPNPIVTTDLRLTKSFSVGGGRRFETFLEAYNATNYTTLTGGSSNMSAAAFLIRTSARDARQVQWGGRFTF
ncbi:MAG: carboxypeptidase regulatory-like domain-containing protein [Vicinamibacterales bacterium]